ncbi:MAG: type II toxin-antitoxin system PemK/MazF family toxin [Chloroflexi bacterium]|nr:type II toxin-antitoxin system PemK/MazF family toxin [Chloroflexota bacterium]
MVTPGPASIVIIPFPFSDLSATKLRPAVVLADTSQGDWLLCQITSNPYSDSQAIEITKSDLKKGALNTVSFVRPMKLFTANEALMLKRVAILKDATYKAILTAITVSLQKNMPK